MADGASIDFKDLLEPVKVFARMEQTLANMTPAMAEVALTMKSQVGRTFQRQRDPIGGSPWKALSKLTLNNRPGGGGGGKPLRDTGRLLQSLIAANPITTANSARIGTNLIYARIQNDGGTIRPVKSKYLAIPLDREADAAGGARQYFDKLKNNRTKVKRLRWPFLGVLDIKTAKFTPKFVLVASVMIPQRRYLGFGQEYQDEIIEIVLDYGITKPFVEAIRQLAPDATITSRWTKR